MPTLRRAVPLTAPASAFGAPASAVAAVASALAAAVLIATLAAAPAAAQQTQKPPLHGRHWIAITGKPLAATAGAMMFQRGGNAVDAAAAMLAATATMWDVLSWGGETQALIYDPRTREVIGINALGHAPTGATAEYFRSRGMSYPPEYGPLAATTPGTPGGLMVMLAEYGTLSLADVLVLAMEELVEGVDLREGIEVVLARRAGGLRSAGGDGAAAGATWRDRRGVGAGLLAAGRAEGARHLPRVRSRGRGTYGAASDRPACCG